MADAKGVVLTFGAAREGRNAVLLAQRRHFIATAGEYFVRIRLMTHVPHQPVIRGVEDVVQRDGQLNDPQACTKMSACLADGIEQFLAQFIGQGFQLGFG